MHQFSQILCAIDFSDESEHALEHAAAMARWYASTITGVFVYDTALAMAPYAFVGPTLLVDADRKALQLRAEALLRSLAQGVPARARLETGRPSDGILAAAKAVGAELIVMGTHGAGGFEHLVLGSVAEHVLRRALCPVMTVPPRARRTSELPFKRILCPVDFSEPSNAAVELATSIAAEGDASLTLLHVLEPDVEEPMTTRPITVPEYHRERECEARAKLTAFVSDDTRDWCKPLTRVCRGKPYREILGVAGEDSADLIVMGVHGRNPIDMTLFGSTTNHVVRRATCPVMTVRS